MKSQGGIGWCCVSKAVTHRLQLVGPVGGSSISKVLWSWGPQDAFQG